MANWLETLRQKQQRVSELEQELAQLKAELRDARAILRGGEAQAPSDKPKSRHGFVGGKRAKPIQRGSSVWWTAHVLFMHGQPMQIDQIVQRIAETGETTVQKPTLVSNLSRYVKHGDTFNRPAPSVYGLIDFGKDPTDV